MTLTLAEEVLAEVEAHAAEAYPEECCGALLGEVPADFGAADCGLEARAARRLPNAWPESGSKTRRYEADGSALAALERELRGGALGVIGFYHSHPDAPAWPSPFDLERAWPAYAYLIVEARAGKAAGALGGPPRARAYGLSEDRRSFVEGAVRVASGGRSPCP